MTAVERNIQQTRWRLMANDWFQAFGWCLTIGCAVWMALVLINKIFGLNWSYIYITSGLAVLALLVSLIWTIRIRQDDLAAAAILDQAANLKERTSSGLCCRQLDDPFAQAVVSDAESINQRLSPRSFIRYLWPASLSYAVVGLLIAVFVAWLPITPWQSKTQAAAADQSKQEELGKQQVQKIQRQLQPLKEAAEKNPALQNLQDKLKSIDDMPIDKIKTPESVRREAVKKIDDLADALKKEKDTANFNKVNELKKMFRSLKATEQPQTPTDKLTQALAKGDFKAAQNAVQEMQEQLAKMQQNPDPEKNKEMQKQLENLSQQLQKAAQQQQQKEQLKKDMEQSGVDKQTAQKAAEQLTKEDQQKIEQQMKQNGASDQQIKDMQKKMESMQQACKQCNNMSDAMQKASQAMQGQSSSGMHDAAEQLQQAADMLNSMEASEQQISEMESTLADLQDMKNDLSQDQNNQGDQGDTCPNCNGKGCSQCGGTGKQKGGGMGKKPGTGRGGMADEEVTDVRFKKERTKVNTEKGSIISKKFVDGEQVAGESTRDAVELITAAEQEATDAINKAKVPNQYRKIVKDYFSQVRSEFAKKAPAEEKKAEDASAEKTAADQESKNDSDSAETESPETN